MPRRNQIPTREPALFLLMGMVLGLILVRDTKGRQSCGCYRPQ